MPEIENRSSDGPLAEFAALRAEILQSQQMQWNSFALELTATAVIFSFALSNSARTPFLLILPPVTYALNNWNVRSLYNMERIGQYIRDELSNRVPGGLGWEEWHKDKDIPQPKRIIGGFSVYFPFPYIFLAASLAALVWTVPYISSARHLSDVNRTFLIIVWVLDLGITMRSLRHIRVSGKARFVVSAEDTVDAPADTVRIIENSIRRNIGRWLRGRYQETC